MILTCSILIVTWNRDDLLGNCLQSLESVYGIAPQIVVVDNAGSESTKKLCEVFENVEYVPSGRNLGFAGGNNLGLKFCKHEIVILLNNDTVVQEDSFGGLLEYLEENKQVGVVQATMNLPLYNDTLDMCGGFLTPVGDIHMRYMFCSTKSVVPKTESVFCAKGACLAFRKSVLKGIVGGCLFHDHFFLNYEETDFCHRVWLNGFEVSFLNTPPIDHLMNQSVKHIDQIEFNSRSLANTLFSWLSLFELRTLIKLLPSFIIMQIIVICSDLMHGRLGALRIFVGAIHRVKQNWSLMRTVRFDMLQCRKISDHELLKRIMIHPPLIYYWHALRGRLSVFAEKY